MNKTLFLILLCPLLLLPEFLSAQSFVLVPLPIRHQGERFFAGVSYASVAFADVDGDNDPDLLITGQDHSLEKVAILYLNDGQGHFAEAYPPNENPLEGVQEGAVAFADVDGDDDLDLVITGNGSFDFIAQLYLNDGQGNFSLAEGTPFEGVFYSFIAFADVDGDEDQDLVIRGQNNSDRGLTRLFLNDGQGKFDKADNTPFREGRNGALAVADIDGDNDPDLAITGWDDVAGNSWCILYRNDGEGNFSLVEGTAFEGTSDGAIAFADIDGDEDPDLLITGIDSDFNSTAKLYRNDGQGNFSIIADTPFEPVMNSAVAFADVDGDEDQDLVLTGDYHTKLYSNDGLGNFSEVSGIPFEGAALSSVAVADVDGDADPDLVVAGLGSLSGNPVTKLYANTLNSPASVPFSSGSGEGSVRFSPNPVSSETVALYYEAVKSSTLRITLSDLVGRTVLVEDVRVVKGTNVLPVDCSALSKGTYVVELQQDGMAMTCRLVVQ